MRLRLRRRSTWPMCRDLMELVTDYLDGAMSAKEVASVDAHLAECPGCRAAIEQFRRAIELTGRLAVDEVDSVDPALRDNLLAIFRDARG